MKLHRNGPQAGRRWTLKDLAARAAFVVPSAEGVWHESRRGTRADVAGARERLVERALVRALARSR